LLMVRNSSRPHCLLLVLQYKFVPVPGTTGGTCLQLEAVSTVHRTGVPGRQRTSSAIQAVETDSGKWKIVERDSDY
jgi:hypothetical protein